MNLFLKIKTRKIIEYDFESFIVEVGNLVFE